MLTHIDDQGNDTPAILVENTTAANRAVNIPEFVNIPVDGLENINPQATDFYRLFDQAYALLQQNKLPEAIQVLHSALEQSPEDVAAHYVLATALSGNDQEREALEEYRKACALDPRNTVLIEHLAVSLALNGNLSGAVEQLQKAIALVPNSVEYRFNLGFVLESNGEILEALAPLEKAVELSRGKDGRCLAELAKAYSKSGHPAQAIQAARQALDLAVEKHDDQTASQLRTAIESYERAAAPAAQ
jgi:Flp pilus assembly protein TadD